MSRIDMRRTDMRLSKTAVNINMGESALEQISDKGRQILKSLEDFKFTLQQSSRVLQNNQQMVKNLETKRKTVDEISNKLYQLVFDIENTNITQNLEQPNTEIKQDVTNESPAGENSAPQTPLNVPPNPNIPGQGTPGAPGTPSAGEPSGGPANPANKSKDEKDDKSKDDNKSKDDKSKDNKSNDDKSNDDKSEDKPNDEKNEDNDVDEE